MYLSLTEKILQHYYKATDCKIFSLHVGLVDKKTHEQHDFNCEIYAPDQHIADRLHSVIATRFERSLNQNLADKFFGLFFPKNKKRSWKNLLPSFRRSISNSFRTGGLMPGQLTKQLYKQLKQVNTETSESQLNDSQRAKTYRNILISCCLYIVGFFVTFYQLLALLLQSRHFDLVQSFILLAILVFFSIKITLCIRDITLINSSDK